MMWILKNGKVNDGRGFLLYLSSLFDDAGGWKKTAAIWFDRYCQSADISEHNERHRKLQQSFEKR